jgi:GTP-binding protein EngB required for normal cell division
MVVWFPEKLCKQTIDSKDFIVLLGRPGKTTVRGKRKDCLHMKNSGNCRFGNTCNFNHDGVKHVPPRATRADVTDGNSSVVSDLSTDTGVPRFDWGPRRGHKKILIVGGTGHGKSTFINSLHNYFGNCSMDDIEVVIPTAHLRPRGVAKHSEAGGSGSESQTQACTEYKFESPLSRNTSITFIDTPGLGDTRGANQDDDNMNMILDIAAESEKNGTLSGIVFVMKGVESRATLSIQTIATVLKGSLPDYILEQLLVVFTMCRFPAACQSRDKIPFRVAETNKFYFDNAAFLRPIATLEKREKKVIQEQWDETMQELDNVLNRIFEQESTVLKTPGGGFAALQEMRMKVKATFHEIKTNVVNMQKALDHMETAESQLAAARAAGKSTANFTRTKTVKQKKLVDCPNGRHSTICSKCTNMCHESCGLDEITTKGSNAFTGCSAFCGSNNCRHCQCSYTEHYHGRKKVVEETSTMEEVIEDIKRKHEQATGEVLAAGSKISSAADFKKLIDKSIAENLSALRRSCDGIKRVASGFNMVDEIHITLGQLKAEARTIHNSKAREVHQSVVVAVEQMLNAYADGKASSDPPRSQLAGGPDNSWGHEPR